MKNGASMLAPFVYPPGTVLLKNIKSPVIDTTIKNIIAASRIQIIGTSLFLGAVYKTKLI